MNAKLKKAVRIIIQVDIIIYAVSAKLVSLKDQEKIKIKKS